MLLCVRQMLLELLLLLLPLPLLLQLPLLPPVAATAAAIKRIFIEKTHSCHTQAAANAHLYATHFLCVHNYSCVCASVCVCVNGFYYNR